MLSDWVVGFADVRVAEEQAGALTELCRAEGYLYHRMEREKDGALTLRFAGHTAGRVTAVCAQRGIHLEILRTGGLPAVGRWARKRAGLLVGWVLSAGMIIGLSQVVWDVRITGNELLSDRDIQESLAACGFGVGTSLVGFRADVTEHRVLLYDERLAWISINRRGTVAYVEVREAKRPPEAEDETGPADIVASRAGQIVRVELENGNVRVGAGETVAEGDLLVSGLFDSDRVGFRATRARAKVYARTARDFHIEIPLSYERKTYLSPGDGEGDGILRENSLIFFGKTVKFSKKTRTFPPFCDTIEKEKPLGLFSDVGFPVSFRTVYHLPYTVTAAERTPGEAEELAYCALSRAIGALPGGAEIVGKRLTVHITDTAYILDCTLTCVEDIAAARPLEIVP